MQLGNTGLQFGQGVWFSGSILTNPTDGTVLVDTGPLEKGNYLMAFMGAGSVAWVYDIEQRNAANNGNVDSQRRRPAAGNEDAVFGSKVNLAENERIRCLLVGNITGQVQMSIFVAEVG